MTFIKKPVVLITIIFGCLGCDESMEPDTSDFGYDYFPLETGFYRVYEVTEIIFPLSGVPDTSVYQLKEVIADSVIDNSGEVNFFIERFKRDLPTEEWETDSIWTSYRNERQAVVNENNIPLLKLVFPLKENKSWDSNSLNARNRDDFTMKEVFMSHIIDQVEFANAVRVVQEEKLDSLISLDNRFEIYAQHVGMVEKVYSRLEFCQESNCFGQQIVEEGRTLYQYIVEYGKE